MKRFISLILLVGSFACGMNEGPSQPKSRTSKIKQSYPHVYIEQVIQDKIKEGKLKKPEDCSFEEAIEQLNKIIASLRFGKDKNYCLNHEELKAKDLTASIYNDLPIIGDAFDRVIERLLQYDRHVKKLVDRVVELIPAIITEENKVQIIEKIDILHPVFIQNIQKQIIILILKNLFAHQSENAIQSASQTLINYKLEVMFFYNIPAEYRIDKFSYSEFPYATPIWEVDTQSIFALIGTNLIVSISSTGKMKFWDFRKLEHKFTKFTLYIKPKTISKFDFITITTSKFISKISNFDWDRTFKGLKVEDIKSINNLLRKRLPNSDYKFSNTAEAFIRNHPWLVSTIGLGTAALTSYGLWKYFKSDN